jgi:hypothetical protein
MLLEQQLELLPLRILKPLARALGIIPGATKRTIVAQIRNLDVESSQLQPPDDDDDDANLEDDAASRSTDDNTDDNSDAGEVNMTTPAETWLRFTEERLDAFLMALGVNITGLQDTQAKAEALAALPGVTPSIAINALIALPTPDNRPKVELHLTKQTSSEVSDAFLARARVHFNLVRATDQEAITLLINAAQPAIAAFITENYNAGITDKETMLKAVQDRFSPNRFQYHEMFRTYKPQASQSARDIGNELRRLYLGFLQFSEELATTHTIAITPALCAQLLQVLPTTTAALLRTEILRKPDMTWEQVLQLADQMRQIPPQSVSAPATRPKAKHCKIHNWGAHDDRECLTQRYSNSTWPNSDKRRWNKEERNRSEFTCYVCGLNGHAARHCPKQQENPNTGSA